MINIKNIYWMLAYAFNNLNEADTKLIDKEEFDNIYDLFCVMLTQEISKLIKRGLFKEYITTTDEISSLKGKILLNDSIKKNSQKKMKMYCEFDVYSENIYLNQIIKTAAMYLIYSKKITDKVKIKKLKNVLNYLRDVDTVSIKTIKWNSIRYTKNNKIYKISINICHLIIDGLLSTKSDGKIEFKNYIDDQKMHKLYEKFILEYYKYHYPNLHAKVSEIGWNIEEKNMISLLPKMKTDITLYYEDRILIIDAKYYSDMYQNNPMFNKNTFRSNNLYQIFTYVKNKDVNKNGRVSGMLLYAKTEKNDEQWAKFSMDGNNIVISNLDLNESFDKVKKHLNTIADKFINNKI